MARLIDADALQLEPDPWGGMNGVLFLGRNGGKTMAMVQSALKRMIDDAPTIDAVPVVRCKDCMWARPKDHRDPTDTPRELICQCFQHHYIPALWGARMAVKPDDFCSYGKRKVNGVGLETKESFRKE